MDQRPSAWNEAGAAAAVLLAALETPRVPLVDWSAIPSGRPGAYLLYMAVGDLRLHRHPELAAYGLNLLSGRACCYAGAAQDLRSRARRHAANLSRSANLVPEDLFIATVPCDSLGGALFAEAVINAELAPVWGHAALRGFGSRPQGRTREAGQRPSPWDCLHRRDWAPEPTPIETAAAVAYLAAQVAGPEEICGVRDRLVDPGPAPSRRGRSPHMGWGT